MKSNVSRLAGALALSLFASLAAAAVDAPAGAQSARVIVKFKADSGLLRKQAASAGDRHAAQAQALAARVGFAMSAGRGVGENTQVMFARGMSSAALAERLSKEKDIEYAVPDRRKTRAAAASDPLYAAGPAVNQANLSGGPVAGQWYLRAPTSAVRSAINAEAAWDVPAATSTPVVVAVLDTGVRFDHPDLKKVSDGGKLLDGYDFITDVATASDGTARDSDASDPGDYLTQADIDTGNFDPCTSADIAPSSWHGTQVSGIVGASTDNGIGMASVGRERVRVLPVRVLGKCGGFDSDIIAGMNWAAGITVPGVADNPAPAKVLNLSLGGTGACSVAYQSAVSALNARGVVVVASAGNGRGQEASEPANCPGVIGVGGVRHEGDKVGYSDIGPELSLSAPAGNCVNDTVTHPELPCLYPILTTANSGDSNPVAGAAGAIYTDAYNATIGTSFSAPLVSGTAALMLSVKPDLPPAQIRQILMRTARAFPVYNDLQSCHAPDSTLQDQCNCTTTTCGAGMLDTNAAVACAQSGGACLDSGGGGGALGLGWLAALALAVAALGWRRGPQGVEAP